MSYFESRAFKDCLCSSFILARLDWGDKVGVAVIVGVGDAVAAGGKVNVGEADGVIVAISVGVKAWVGAVTGKGVDVSAING